MSARGQEDAIQTIGGCGCMFTLAAAIVVPILQAIPSLAFFTGSWADSWPWWYWSVAVLIIGTVLSFVAVGLVEHAESSDRQRRAQHHQEQLRVYQQEQEQRIEARRQEQARQDELRRQEIMRAEEQRNRRIDELLGRDDVLGSVHYMNGHEFERFMADLFRKQGYSVERTPGSGDQGIDLLVDLEGRKVAIQLKRWRMPVGNKAVQETFTGMFYYQAHEGWLITTSSFTKSAKDAASKTGVRLIDGTELTEWMSSIPDEQ